MTMLKVGVEAAAARAAVERKIAHSWDRLAGLVDDGTIPESRLAYVVKHEPAEDAPTLLLSIWAAQLARWCSRPKEIGVDWDAMATSTCRCGDTGWVEYFDREGRPVARPCERCNGVQYRRWAEHWADPAHSCPDCDGHPQRARGGRQATDPTHGGVLDLDDPTDDL